MSKQRELPWQDPVQANVKDGVGYGKESVHGGDSYNVTRGLERIHKDVGKRNADYLVSWYVQKAHDLHASKQPAAEVKPVTKDDVTALFGVE